MPTLLVHSSLEQTDIDQVIDAVAPNVKVSKHPGFNTNADVDRFFISNYKAGDPVVGLLYHNPEDGSIPFFNNTALMDIKGVMDYFFMKCKQKNVKTVDLITCNINNIIEQNELSRLSSEYNLDIRYSVDTTSDMTNWILESHNVNIKPVYFSKDLPLLSLLGLSGFNYHFALSSNNKLLFFGNGDPSKQASGMTLFNVGTNYTSYVGRGASNLIINQDGSLTKFGANSYGELAVPGNQYVFEPQTDTNYNYQQISSGLDGVIALIDDNGTTKAVACGRNYCYANGVGLTGYNLSSWSVCIDSNDNQITGITQVERGYMNSWILKDDGTVWGCGKADFHQLTGNGTSQSGKFVQIQRKSGSTYAPLTGVSKLCVGAGDHPGACAVMNTGSVLIWGLGGTGNTASVETTSAECGTREISIPGETIVDMYPFSTEFYHKIAYLKTASGKYYTVGSDQIPVEDTTLANGSADIGGAGRYVTQLVRHRQGFLVLVDNGDVYYRGRFVYGEAPYTNDYNSSWIKHPYLSQIADIDSYAYDIKCIDNTGNIRYLGKAGPWDFGFNPNKWYELNHFSGKQPVQWASIGFFTAILDTNGDVYIRTYHRPIGSVSEFTELFITGNATQIVAAEGYGIIILKADGTVHYWGNSNVGSDITSSYTLQQWGGVYKDTVQFVMVAASSNALYALDNNGNVYASGNVGNYIDISAPINTSSSATIIKSYDDYNTGNESWAGPNNKIVSIYATEKTLFMVFEGGFVCPVGYSWRNRFGNGTGDWSPGYSYVRDSANNPIQNIIEITAANYQYGSMATIYRTSSGKVYFSGYSPSYSINGVGSRQSPYNCIELTSLYGAYNIIYGQNGSGLMYTQNGNTYVLGNRAYIGAATGVITNGPTVSSAYLLSDSIGTDFTIKDVNRNFVYGGAIIETNINNIVSNFSGLGLRYKIKEFILTNSPIFTNKSFALQGSSVIDLFSGSFATEMQSSSRSVRMKLKTGNKYVINATDLTGLGNGDVLYIADEGTSTGTDVVLNIGGTDYTYKLFTDKITYNSTDYVIGDTITFGTLNLVVKGLSSTEFIQEGTSGGPPCFGGNTYIQTPTGPVMIKDLKDGDLVTTNEGPQPVIIHKSIIAKTNKSSAPYIIKKHAFSHNVPNQDTIVSPLHMFLFNGNKFSHPRDLSKYTDNVYQTPAGSKQHYYNIETPNYLNHIISANNLMAEPYSAKQIPKTHKLLFVKQSGPFFNRIVVPKSSIPHLLK